MCELCDSCPVLISKAGASGAELLTGLHHLPVIMCWALHPALLLSSQGERIRSCHGASQCCIPPQVLGMQQPGLY